MSETPATRAAIYAFIHDDLKVAMTDKQKNELKKLLVANANSLSEDLLKEIEERKAAYKQLQEAKVKKIFIRVRPSV